MIPSLSPAYVGVTEQQRKYAYYPIPDTADVSAIVVYLHLVAANDTSKKVIPARDPYEFINIAVKEAINRPRENSEEDEDQQKKKGGRGKSGPG